MAKAKSKPNPNHVYRVKYVHDDRITYSKIYTKIGTAKTAMNLFSTLETLELSVVDEIDFFKAKPKEKIAKRFEDESPHLKGKQIEQLYKQGHISEEDVRVWFRYKWGLSIGPYAE